MSPSPTSHPWIGRFIGDNQRYRLDKRLGGGGMGDVFLAMDTRVGQHVALKLLKDTLVESTEMRKRFEREIAICAALSNEHIVKISDCGVSPEGYPFFVMEYLRGETLRELLLREKRLSVERSVRIISQICNGLELAHQGVTLPNGEHIQQVVHRDIKPDNIFLVSTDLGEWVKIVDFGIAKIHDERYEQITLANTFIGTLHYAAPEQFKGYENLDTRADIYSLGVILYEMLSGIDPFGLTIQSHYISEASWIIAHTSEQPRELRSQPNCEQLSAKLAAVVMRCLEKDPNLRFASVEALNEALQISLSKGVTSPVLSNSEVTLVQKRTLGTIDLDAETRNQPAETLVQIQSSSEFLRQGFLEETITQNPQQRQELFKLRANWLLYSGAFLLIALLLIGSIYTYFRWQSHQVLEEILSLKQQTNYEQCIAKSEEVTPKDSIYAEVESILNECRLRYAQKLASNGQLVEAINIVKKISEHSPLYPEAQRELQDWEQI